jgi:hypothetical protein
MCAKLAKVSFMESGISASVFPPFHEQAREIRKIKTDNLCQRICVAGVTCKIRYIMAAWLVKSFLPVVSKVKFCSNVPRNFEKCKHIYPEASMYIL